MRALVILVLLIGGGLGWAVRIVRRAAAQHEAVSAIEKASGYVRYDWEWKNGSRIPAGRRRRPGWLARRIGVDYLHDVVAVFLLHDLSDSDLAIVGHFRELEQLQYFKPFMPAGGPRVTDAGLMHLEGLSRLQELDLSATDVTDLGLGHLRGLTGLRDLNLSNTDVSDAGLVHLTGLSRLESLDLHDTRVSNSGIVRLKGLTALRSLDITFTKADDWAAQELRRANSKLKVSFTGIIMAR